MSIFECFANLGVDNKRMSIYRFSNFSLMLSQNEKNLRRTTGVEKCYFVTTVEQVIYSKFQTNSTKLFI